jgi:hypothetical protein
MTALAGVVPQTFGQCGYLLEGSENGPITDLSKDR